MQKIKITDKTMETALRVLCKTDKDFKEVLETTAGTTITSHCGPETLGIFAEINRESMTDDIGLLHTLGSNATPISFKDSSNTRNNVSDAIDEIYNSFYINLCSGFYWLGYYFFNFLW